VLGFDERGKVKLSMRVVDQATGEDITEKVGPKPGRSDRERGERGDRDRGDRQPEQAAD
jgi:polyribonucleotide nucleotidyltransferase